MRTGLKRTLSMLGAGARPRGATLLTYHRVGGGSGDELDLPRDEFARQLDLLRDARVEVLSLDTALDRLDAGDDRPTVVVTFDDGWRELYDNAWPLLEERGMPFTLYLTAGCVGRTMSWQGATGTGAGSPALSWEHVREMAASGLCSVANHTWSHPTPDVVDIDDIERCSDAIAERFGRAPEHFAYTWGIPVPRLREALAARFRSVATGQLGRNRPAADRLALRRLPVRGSDPLEFFRAKIAGSLVPERAYDVVVRTAKRVGVRG